MGKIKVGNVSRSEYREMVSATFTRELGVDDVRRLLDEPYVPPGSHGSLLSVRDALSLRNVTVDEVLEDDRGNAVAIAHSSRGPVIQMGDGPYMALQYLVTTVLR